MGGNACIETYLSLSSPHAVSRPWLTAEQAGAAAFLTPAPVDALAVLSQRHSAAELIESGLLQHRTAGQVAMHESLPQGGIAFFPLVDAATNEALQIVTDHGCLKQELPIFMAHLDVYELLVKIKQTGDRDHLLQARLLDPNFFPDPIRRIVSGIQG